MFATAVIETNTKDECLDEIHRYKENGWIVKTKCHAYKDGYAAVMQKRPPKPGGGYR
jgi:hypothetical protein